MGSEGLLFAHSSASLFLPNYVQKLVGKSIFVVPYLYDLHLPEEDGLGVERRLANEHGFVANTKQAPKCDVPQKPVVVVLAYPHVSITDDLTPLESDSRFTVQWRRDTIPPPYPHTTAVILPGSRLTRSDLLWLSAHPRWVTFLQDHVAAGGAILGLCGGYQMLGMEVADPNGVEGKAGISVGLCLLPVKTTIEPVEYKVVAPMEATLDLPDGNESVQVEGFELHCGQTEFSNESIFNQEARPLITYNSGETEGTCMGHVCGTYLHGILNSSAARKFLLANDCTIPDDSGEFEVDQLDRLAEHLAKCGLDFGIVSNMFI